MKIESLRFDEVTFIHEGHDPVLQNSSFEFPLGQVVWLKADEGVGKSSLLQILGCLQTPSAGRYFINGENVLDMNFEDFLPYRLQIGYSFDYGGLINNKSIFDNLTLPLLYHKLCTPGDAKKRANVLLERFDLLKFANERPAHVPGRVRKLACLLRALITRPQILLLDDPSVGISAEAARELAGCINEYREQGCLQHIVMCSYDEGFIRQFDHQTVYLEGGQLYLLAGSAEKKVVHL